MMSQFCEAYMGHETSLGLPGVILIDRIYE